MSVPVHRKHSLVLVLAFSLAGSIDDVAVSKAEAQDVRKSVERPRKKQPRRHAGERVPRDDGRNFLRDPEDLPFGSTDWWRAMDLRRRGGFGGEN